MEVKNKGYEIKDSGNQRVLVIGTKEYPTYYSKKIIELLIERKGIARTPQYFTGVPITDTNIIGNSPVFINNLNFIIQTSPGTSYLWNENREYLTEKYNTSTISYNLLNSIRMIKYFLLGKDTNLLGSDSGVLEFKDDTRTLKYGSSLIYQWKNTQTFEKYRILFKDPLLGTFTGNII